jgi:hypothetical protein
MFQYLCQRFLSFLIHQQHGFLTLCGTFPLFAVLLRFWFLVYSCLLLDLFSWSDLSALGVFTSLAVRPRVFIQIPIWTSFFFYCDVCIGLQKCCTLKRDATSFSETVLHIYIYMKTQGFVPHSLQAEPLHCPYFVLLFCRIRCRTDCTVYHATNVLTPRYLQGYSCKMMIHFQCMMITVYHAAPLICGNCNIIVAVKEVPSAAYRWQYRQYRFTAQMHRRSFVTCHKVLVSITAVWTCQI